jgi:hypothetical protein
MVFKRTGNNMKKNVLIKLSIILLFVLFGCGVEPEYYTNHGMGVTVGERNNPGPRTVEFWTDQTIVFWRLYEPHWLQCMNNVTNQVHAFFVDEDHVSIGDKAYAGFAHRNDLTIEISYGEAFKIRGVFIHELSHIYVGECGGVWSTNGSHAIFDEANLQALTIY